MTENRHTRAQAVWYAAHQTERLAAYELDDKGEWLQGIGYLPKDAPRQTGRYLAILQRQEGKRRINGKLSALRDHAEHKSDK